MPAVWVSTELIVAMFALIIGFAFSLYWFAQREIVEMSRETSSAAFEHLETELENNQERKIISGDEMSIAEYLTGLIETYRESEIDFTAGAVSDEDLEMLQGLGYVQ